MPISGGSTGGGSIALNEGTVTISDVSNITLTGTGVTLTDLGSGSAEIHIPGAAGGAGIGTLIASGISSSASLVALPMLPIITPPAAAGFSFLNQNSATLTDNANGPLVLASNATNGTNLCTFAGKPVSGSFTLTANATMISHKSFCGFAVTDGTKFHVILKNQADAGIYVQRYSNTTTFSSSDAGPLWANFFTNPAWFRIIWNAGTTTITFQASCDGITWYTCYSTNTPYVTPNACGMLINVNQSAGVLTEMAINYWAGL